MLRVWDEKSVVEVKFLTPNKVDNDHIRLIVKSFM